MAEGMMEVAECLRWIAKNRPYQLRQLAGEPVRSDSEAEALLRLTATVLTRKVA